MPGAVFGVPAMVAKKVKASKESAPAMMDESAIRSIGGGNDGSRPPPSRQEIKNNNQLAMGACDEEGKGSKATAVRVASEEEGKGNKEGNGVGNKAREQQREQWLWQQEQWQQGWWQLMATKAMVRVKATAWAMAMATRLVDNKEGKGKGSKGNGDGDEGGGQQKGDGNDGKRDGNDHPAYEQQQRQQIG
jgi:hypothetical protein